ncbi:hypothetical protein EIP91_005384 [Steccherinum ochraceum]|uniref:Uncharacterized protein n=1 Tax=Steccherinum ochraceum TaxID=92696 RepID=A0A4R0R9Z1_9APHY|nr:hypothetical protein EIP91_005384 [Steccherinum ochraceum]
MRFSSQRHGCRRMIMDLTSLLCLQCNCMFSRGPDLRPKSQQQLHGPTNPPGVLPRCSAADQPNTSDRRLEPRTGHQPTQEPTQGRTIARYLSQRETRDSWQVYYCWPSRVAVVSWSSTLSIVVVVVLEDLEVNRPASYKYAYQNDVGFSSPVLIYIISSFSSLAPAAQQRSRSSRPRPHPNFKSQASQTLIVAMRSTTILCGLLAVATSSAMAVPLHARDDDVHLAARDGAQPEHLPADYHGPITFGQVGGPMHTVHVREDTEPQSLSARGLAADYHGPISFGPMSAPTTIHVREDTQAAHLPADYHGPISVGPMSAPTTIHVREDAEPQHLPADYHGPIAVGPMSAPTTIHVREDAEPQHLPADYQGPITFGQQGGPMHTVNVRRDGRRLLSEVGR